MAAGTHKADYTTEKWEEIKAQKRANAAEHFAERNARRRARYAAKDNYYIAQIESARKRIGTEEEALRLRALRAQRRVQWLDFLSDKACLVCGETDPITFDFHHREPKKNHKRTVSYLVRSGQPWEVIMEEVAKCDILCANCHRQLHEALRINKVLTKAA